MNIKLKEDALVKLLDDIEKYGFTADGCNCGEYAYQLDENLHILFYRSCHKASGTPDDKWWHMHNAEFYRNIDYSYEEHDGDVYRIECWSEEEDKINNVNLDKKQLEIIKSKLIEISKVYCGDEFMD